MEKLAVNFRNNGEQEVASAFNKFAEFSKELLTPMKNLVRHMELREGLLGSVFNISHGLDSQDRPYLQTTQLPRQRLSPLSVHSSLSLPGDRRIHA